VTRAPASVSLTLAASAYRVDGAVEGMDPDAWGLEIYGRADRSQEVLGGDGRAYLVARYDETPYAEYDFRSTQASGGLSFGRGAWWTAVSASWGRTESGGDDDDVQGAGVDLRWQIVPGTLGLRGSARWTAGSGGGEDYTRATHTGTLTWGVGPYDVKAEYRYLDRDDRASPDESYEEHIWILAVGRGF